jgi:hypothetical protein
MKHAKVLFDQRIMRTTGMEQPQFLLVVDRVETFRIKIDELGVMPLVLQRIENALKYDMIEALLVWMTWLLIGNTPLFFVVSYA